MVVARDLATLLSEGLAAHQVGKLDLAETRYRAVLRATPRHPDALHLLGVVALQQGRLDEAEATIRRALAVAPEQAAFWNSLGVLLRTRGPATGGRDELRARGDAGPGRTPTAGATSSRSARRAATQPEKPRRWSG